MPIQIQAPDGAIVEFPDGTPNDVMERAMQQEYGGGQQSAPAGDPNHWGTAYQAADTVTMGGSTKLGAAGQSVLDATLGAVQGKGWNYSDAYDKNLAQARADQSAYQQESPIMSGLGTAGGIAMGVTSLPSIGRGLAGAIGTGAGYGAGGGALRDADSWTDRAWNTAKGAGVGGLLGGTIYGAAKGVSSLLGLGKTAPPPTAGEWKDKARDLYTAAEQGAGQGQMSVDDVLKLADDFESVAGKAGIDSPLAPIATKPYKNTLDTVSQFRQIATDIAAGNKSQPNYTQLEQLRQSMRDQIDDLVNPAGKLTKDGEKMDRLLDAVDNMLLNSPFEEARAAWSTYIKADKLERAFFKAENAAGSNYTQAGMEKAIQNEFRNLANNKNFRTAFTPEEQDAILKVVRPGGVHRVVKMFGGFAPKGGLSMMFNVGMTVNNPLLGGALGTATTAAKAGSTAKTLNNAKLADEMVRSQGVLPTPNTQSVDQLQRLMLPPAGLLGDAYLRQRSEYGGPR